MARYLFVEVIFSSAIVLGWLQTEQQEYCFVDTGSPLRFDPISGYRISNTPTPLAQFADNKLVYVSEWRGNQQGFQDSKDFTAKPTDKNTYRIAIMGDSYTAAPYLKVNWPERCEMLANEEGVNLEFMNFAVDGSGIANWWSIVTRLLEPEGYQIDALLFAVFDDNLERSFFFSQCHKGYTWCGYDPIPYGLKWDVSNWPTTPKEAMRSSYRDAALVSQERFDRALQEKRFLPVRPYFAKYMRTTMQFVILLYRLLWEQPEQNQELKSMMWEQMAKFASDRGVKVYVFRVPHQGTLSYPESNAQIEDFSIRLGADYYDGVKAFPEGKSHEEYSDYFLYKDPHWCQLGSDKFADYVYEIIASDREREYSKVLKESN